MKTIFAVLSVTFLLTSVVYSQGQKVDLPKSENYLSKITICENVVNKNIQGKHWQKIFAESEDSRDVLVAVDKTISQGKKYFHLVLIVQKNTYVTYEFYHGEDLVHSFKDETQVTKSPNWNRWRSWCHKDLNKPGLWTVLAFDADDKYLGGAQFNVK